MTSATEMLVSLFTESEDPSTELEHEVRYKLFDYIENARQIKIKSGRRTGGATQDVPVSEQDGRNKHL